MYANANAHNRTYQAIQHMHRVVVAEHTVLSSMHRVVVAEHTKLSSICTVLLLQNIQAIQHMHRVVVAEHIQHMHRVVVAEHTKLSSICTVLLLQLGVFCWGHGHEWPDHDCGVTCAGRQSCKGSR